MPLFSPCHLLIGALPAGCGPGSGIRSPEIGVARVTRIYPNPARGWVRFQLSLPRAGQVRLAIYDVAGRLVRALERALPAGVHERPWDARDSRDEPVPAGIYYSEVTAGGQPTARQLVILR